MGEFIMMFETGNRVKIIGGVFWLDLCGQVLEVDSSDWFDTYVELENGRCVWFSHTELERL